jgi:hypothetical protein
MGAVSGLGDSYDLPNYVGELFSITPSDTPFLSMIGGLTGGKSTTSPQFTWQTVDNASAAQPSITENDSATAPTAAQRSRSEVINVCQIHHYALDMTYRKLASVGKLGGQAIVGNQPVQDEFGFQLDLLLKRAARDMDYSALQGAYVAVTNATTATTTRGLKNAITTNTVAAGSAVVTRAMFQEVLREMAASGAPFENVVVFANAFNKQVITDIYAYAPDHRNIGGVNIRSIETDFGMLGVCYERQMPTDEIYLVDVSVCAPVFLNTPSKGHFFFEPLGTVGASERGQLYGEFGLEYGPEQWHGSLTGTATSA